MKLFLSILTFISLGLNHHIQDSNHTVDAYSQIYLKTGWYYVSDSERGQKRRLKNTQTFYFIKSNPIVTVKNFEALKIYKRRYSNYELIIKLDKEGTEAWAKATRKSIGKELALLIDNELIHVPIVNAEIKLGVTGYNRTNLSKKEVKKVKKQIKKNKLCCKNQH